MQVVVGATLPYRNATTIAAQHPVYAGASVSYRCSQVFIAKRSFCSAEGGAGGQGIQNQAVLDLISVRIRAACTLGHLHAWG